MSAELVTNQDKVVIISVEGEITSPLMNHPFSTGGTGESFVLPKYGGIVYNIRVGDKACGWLGDHVEPGVSIKNGHAAANAALVQLSCIGNEAKVVSGEAKGARGKVTGCHGGVDHALVDFPPDVLEQLSVGDRVLVKAWGQGLAVAGSTGEGVKVMNVDPRLFKRLARVADGVLEIPVVAEFRAEWMGSGHGFMPPQGADFDVTTTAPNVRSYLDEVGLRLGDVVAVKDHWCEFGFTYVPGAVTVGVVVHCDSLYAGHGPGVRVIATARDGARIRTPKVREHNITQFLYTY